MNRILKIYILPAILFLIILVAPFGRPYAQAAFYKYVDKNGNIYFTDSLETIPEEYRDQIKVFREQRTPEITSPPAREKGEATEEQGRKLREAEEKKKEEEAKALQEKAEREEKRKARQGIEERISELQLQIIAKREEQRSLRTTWMVYDRIRFNQLNDEVADLEKEIESLRMELASK